MCVVYEPVTAQTCGGRGSEAGLSFPQSLQSIDFSYKTKWMVYLRLVPLRMEEKSSAQDKKLKS